MRATLSYPTLAILAAIAAAICAVTVPWVRRLALARGAVDLPEARRELARPTPRLGGLAVFLGAAVALALAALTGKIAPGVRPPGLWALTAGTLLVLGVGVVDDLRGLRPPVKLAIEVVAALVVVWAGGCRINALSIPGGVFHLGAMAVPFTVLWIVLVTNALNLIDGIDGLAAGTSAITLIAVAVIAHGFGYPMVAACAAAVAGACLGFLVFNHHPASIFLGDSGSLVLGFVIAVLSTHARAKGAAGAVTLATLLIVALPLGDTLFTIERRYFQGLRPGSPRSYLAGLRRIFQPDRRHLHHRLLRLGLGHRGAAYALYGIQAIACGYAVYLLIGR
jgi:UDP-GlcNAc:undecaprenyl-phosphate GlcNAc-1-phosphate transferase